MKLQISFDIPDLDKALQIASTIHERLTIIEVGSLLIYKYGDNAIRQFRELFPQKTILANMKIVDKGKEATIIAINAGADWVTVLAGTNRNIIHTVCSTAHALGKKVMLDLIDTNSPGQSALEAQSLGVDALLFHKPVDDDVQLTTLERWDMVKGNTKLPIFVSGNVNRTNIATVLEIAPDGVVIGKSIIENDNPLEEIQYFSSIIDK